MSCGRRNNSNLDVCLFNIVYNVEALKTIVQKNKIRKIFFTSRFVESLFIKQFKELIKQYPGIKLITLPSPSPRYAVMDKAEKINRYKKLLPKLRQ